MGKYVCTQGVTGVTLEIERYALEGRSRFWRRDAIRADARFTFYAVAENPDVPAGSYLMSGYVESSDGRIDVALFPDRWIAKPAHYAMTSLAVSGDATGHALFGRIQSDSGRCTWIDLTRVE
jgi:hypothetical protein